MESETAEHAHFHASRSWPNADIAERRVPQDGSFSVRAGSDRDIDLRLSIMPCIHGEDAVLRVLDKRAMIEEYGALTLDALGFDAESLKVLRRLAASLMACCWLPAPRVRAIPPPCMAPSAKSMMDAARSSPLKTRVEYQLPGILQTPWRMKKELSVCAWSAFDSRHDPDKIMVGEIRDMETAEIAVQSALTGHLVLTTVHANNVFDVLGLLRPFGHRPLLICFGAQRYWGAAPGARQLPAVWRSLHPQRRGSSPCCA